jgi:hypothetical protein
MTEIVRFLALAAALGLAAGMLLGGVALLLAAPAHATQAVAPPAMALECMPVARPARPARLEI